MGQRINHIIIIEYAIDTRDKPWDGHNTNQIQKID